jgi:hypothetical protein
VASSPGFKDKYLTSVISPSGFCAAVMGVVAASALTLSAAAVAQESHGTAQEARALLDKVVAALKADKTKALAMFNKGECGFRDCDLYPFCFNISDGEIVAVGNPNTKGLLGLRRL